MSSTTSAERKNNQTEIVVKSRYAGRGNKYLSIYIPPSIQEKCGLDKLNGGKVILRVSEDAQGLQIIPYDPYTPVVR